MLASRDGILYFQKCRASWRFRSLPVPNHAPTGHAEDVKRQSVQFSDLSYSTFRPDAGSHRPETRPLSLQVVPMKRRARSRERLDDSAPGFTCSGWRGTLGKASGPRPRLSSNNEEYFTPRRLSNHAVSLPSQELMTQIRTFQMIVLLN